jgi:hypothetical protein
MMNVTDYNKKLAEIKSSQAQDNQEVRDTYSKEVSDLNSKHAKNRKDQFENYKNERLKDEAATTNRIAEYDNKIESEIKEKTRMFSDRLEEERSKYSRANASELRRYNKKLGILSESFESADREREQYNNQVRKEANQNFKSNLKDRENSFRHKVEELGESTNMKVAELKNQQEAEKLNMNIRHSTEFKKTVEENNKDRNLAKNLHQEELQKLRDNSSDQRESQKANNEVTIKNLKESESLSRNDLISTYADLTQRLQDKNVRDTKEINATKKKLNNDMNRKIASVRLESSKRENLRSTPKDTIDRFSPMSEVKKGYEARIDHIQNTLVDNNKSNDMLNQKVAKNNRMAMDDANEAHNKEKENLIRNLNKDRQIATSEQKDRFSNYEVETKRTNRALTKQLEDNSVSSRKDKNASLSAQKMRFDEKLTHMNETNTELLSAIKEDMAKEQSKVFQKAKKDKHEEMRDLKAGLTHSFSLKEASLSKQIENKDNKIENLTKTFDDKMSALKKMTQEQVEAIRSHEEDRRVEDRLSVQREMKLQQIEFDKMSSSMKNDFDKKLSKAKNTNDIQVMKLTRRYEDMLRTERTNFTKEQNRRQSLVNSELKNMKENNISERENIIKQYEAKLSKLREANRVANELKSMRDSNPDIS